MGGQITSDTGTDGKEGDCVDGLHPARMVAAVTQKSGNFTGDGIRLFRVVIHESKYNRRNRIHTIWNDRPVKEHGFHGKFQGTAGRRFNAV